jgi:hypothetical protein
MYKIFNIIYNLLYKIYKIILILKRIKLNIAFCLY